ncbi:Permease of the drug/metabolite transporter (DMT) superfamily [Hydrobacter penzbergensis]|uniref:Permease of the drug/metabolite transporter (DMT) superfamily n=1 Tax=Hydrobacter penzbergensis TaxID=1235997 RepID=A0A8X8IE21_9BACT|nr:EamA family transporter [Hydrobacter penzbergensis]SDX25901.1 Permease of the drug/metabolite transporter (DMT) superfamily [Hydrobacter penzbergensis]
MRLKFIWIGIIFAILWSSASAATKFGLQSAQPFVIAVSRFFLASFLMLGVSHGIFRKRLPVGKEWKQLIIYGLLNISIYLGLYVLAMQKIAAGIGSLGTATNPVMISFISTLFLGQKMTVKNIASLLLCMAGVFVAAYPLLENSYASTDGILILLASMLSYSVGAIYYARQKWNDLNTLTINGWQTLLGGIFLLPVLLFTYRHEQNSWDYRLIGSVVWLALPVSIGAVQCWLWLLTVNPLKASYWLFLCPVFGFIIASITLHEPLGIYTLMGVMMVVAGLYIIQQQRAVKK